MAFVDLVGKGNRKTLGRVPKKLSPKNKEVDEIGVSEIFQSSELSRTTATLWTNDIKNKAENEENANCRYGYSKFLYKLPI